MANLELNVYNRQRKHRPDLSHHRLILKTALPLCLAVAKSDDAPLRHLEEIELSIISDKEIARIHGEFLEDPTPTDVITFHHGEILVSADTAAREGPENGLGFQEELALYMIHGLMHLGGWDDHEAAEAAEMARHQESILAACLQAHPGKAG